MFKKASDKKDSIERTGSHATKPFGGGRVDVLPPEARPWEEVFLSFKEQYGLAESKLDAAFGGLRKCDERLMITMSRQEYENTVRSRAQWSEKILHYQRVCRELRDIAKKAASNSFAGCFLDAAKLVLTDAEFGAVMASAREIQGSVASLEPIMPYMPPPTLVPLTEEQRRQQRKNYRKVLRPNSPGAIADTKATIKWLKSGAKSSTD